MRHNHRKRRTRTTHGARGSRRRERTGHPWVDCRTAGPGAGQQRFFRGMRDDTLSTSECGCRGVGWCGNRTMQRTWRCPGTLLFGRARHVWRELRYSRRSHRERRMGELLHVLVGGRREIERGRRRQIGGERRRGGRGDGSVDGKRSSIIRTRGYHGCG